MLALRNVSPPLESNLFVHAGINQSHMQSAARLHITTSHPNKRSNRRIQWERSQSTVVSTTVPRPTYRTNLGNFLIISIARPILLTDPA